LWSQTGYPLLPAYRELATQGYGAELRQVDFNTQGELAVAQINQWISERTKGKIPALLTARRLDESTRVVLANAIYFKGTWARRFDSNLTRLQPFKISPTNHVEAQLMGHVDAVPYVGNETFQAVELPYTGELLSMVIFLPRNFEGLKQLEGWLSQEFVSQWLLRMRKQEVELFLPRFQMASTFALEGELAKMGMSDAFSPKLADFSGISGSKGLFISSVFHKAWVDVAEEGTEAAAATATQVALSGTEVKPRPRPPIFRADHPFVFLIREKSSGAVLFLGRVDDPNKGAGNP